MVLVVSVVRVAAAARGALEVQEESGAKASIWASAPSSVVTADPGAAGDTQAEEQEEMVGSALTYSLATAAASPLIIRQRTSSRSMLMSQPLGLRALEGTQAIQSSGSELRGSMG